MEKIQYLGESILRWKAGASTFLALPEKGARLMHWNLTLGDGTVRDVVYWPELAQLGPVEKVRGGNPILFPFCARTYDQGEIHFWRGPDGVRRPMPMHGFARQGAFRVLRADDKGFAARLVPDEAARLAYPFDYEFDVSYRFEGLGLGCELTLHNLGNVPIPWCPGHHFYFAVPWAEGSARGDYLIRIPASERLRPDEKGRLVKGPKLKPEESLANPELLETFHLGLASREVVFGEKGRPGDVIVRIGSTPKPDPDATIVTWTQDEGSPFYCVEPWMGPANALEHGRGLSWVQPGQTKTFVVGVSLR